MDLLLGLFCRFLVDIKDDDARPLVGVPEGNRSSDAGTTTGDHG
jgi:hypothetical protein